ncbi:hypothetical protein [Kordia sp.]|uniref:hypothetical protein n=1 Tax=Kordia sp. TaxID=1965332 RepID=UPI003D6A0022
MIDINKLVRVSTKRLNQAVVKQNKSDKFHKKYISENLPYFARLIDACKSQKDKPNALHDIAFVSNPERFLSKISYMAIGDVRKKNNTNLTKDFHENELEFLNSCAELVNDTEYSNLHNLDDINKIENVVMAHGLSPTSDSLALLMDIGRVFRFSEAFQKPMNVLLADISWMSSNRSIRQFDTLTSLKIDEGLRICLDKRQRLYSALDMNAVVKKIISFEKKHTINSKKLKTISKYYIDLSKAIWGERTKGQLNVGLVKTISKPFQNLEHHSDLVKLDIPEHIRVFAQFPGVLQKLEESLEEHIEILRSIAKHFNSFDEEIFTYFFAQYYAQKEFRDNHIKISPFSETKFDKPFDDLDKYFSTWGEGHSTAHLLLSGVKQIASEKKLSAIYLPQYQIGKFKILPYNSLSLDILRTDKKDHKIINKELICIDYNQSFNTIKEILLNTPLIQRNRIISDISSFLLLCVKSTNIDYVNEKFNETIGYSLNDAYKLINSEIELIFNQETNAIADKDLKQLWETWLKRLDDTSNEGSTYMPLHFNLLLLLKNDWENEDIITGITNIIIGTIAIYQDFTK